MTKIQPDLFERVPDAYMAERQNRRWLVIEKCLDYIRPSA